jgi:hypothetical protein
MAGCMFTNGIHVLGGWQNQISGLGGKPIRSDQTTLDTAWRETLEELFELPAYLVDFHKEAIIAFTKPKLTVHNKDYTCFVYSFADLEKVMAMLGKYHTLSPLYKKFPRTIGELVLTRRICATEVKQLCLLPFVTNMSLAPEYIDDVYHAWRKIPRHPFANV